MGCLPTMLMKNTFTQVLTKERVKYIMSKLIVLIFEIV